MDLDRQIRELIKDAPKDGVTPQLVAAIAPGLKVLAGNLRHRQYYIEQGFEQDWVVTTLRDRANPKFEKCVIYAFPTLQDVSMAATQSDAQVIAVPVPVTHLLFQLLALETVNSIIFFETPGELNTGIEIQRQDLQNLIQLHLKQSATPNPRPSYLPPDIA